MSERRLLRLEQAESDARVTTLELFFDLVFVFALTQVTALMSEDLTGRGILRGLFVLGLLWWSWTGYAWLGNTVRADEGALRPAMFAAMANMFVLALAIPEAFDDLPGGLRGPVVVAVCYLLFRLLHLLLFWIISREDRALRRQLVRFIPSVAGGTVFLLAASQFTGATQTWLWGLALLADYGGTYLGGARGWSLHSPGHFAERHGLILIVALGESIVAIGVGVAEAPVTWPIVVASAMGLAVAAAIWWIYFDVTSIMAENALAAEPEATRAQLARDAYSFLHFPMIVGVVLMALGLKKVLEYVGDTELHGLADPLQGPGLYALLGGMALYLLAHVAFKLRTTHHLSRSRLLGAAVLIVAMPLAGSVPALATLALGGLVLAVVVGYETLRAGVLRQEVRHQNAHD